MNKIDENIQQGETPAEDNINNLIDSSSLSYSDLIKERSFLGETPAEVIFEGIENQFSDYINMEDKNNYVDMFYNQLYMSYDRLYHDDSEEHPVEIKEILDNLKQEFVDMMQRLFDVRLTITITDLELGSISDNDLEYIIRRLYEFFIMNARTNFKTVIAADIVSRNPRLAHMDDDEYFMTLQALINDYSPLITSITPTNFLKYRGDVEMQELYNNGRVAGNFLRKYTPKLYRNEEFAIELVNHITMIHNFKKDVIDDKI